MSKDDNRKKNTGGQTSSSGQNGGLAAASSDGAQRHRTSTGNEQSRKDLKLKSSMGPEGSRQDRLQATKDAAVVPEDARKGQSRPGDWLTRGSPVLASSSASGAADGGRVDEGSRSCGIGGIARRNAGTLAAPEAQSCASSRPGDVARPSSFSSCSSSGFTGPELVQQQQQQRRRRNAPASTVQRTAVAAALQPSLRKPGPPHCQRTFLPAADAKIAESPQHQSPVTSIRANEASPSQSTSEKPSVRSQLSPAADTRLVPTLKHSNANNNSRNRTSNQQQQQQQQQQQLDKRNLIDQNAPQRAPQSQHKRDSEIASSLLRSSARHVIKTSAGQTQRALNNHHHHKSSSSSLIKSDDQRLCSQQFNQYKRQRSNLSNPITITMADQAVIDKLEAGFAKLQAATPDQCHSLLKKYLTREVLDKLKTKKTAMGATLLDVVQSGFENLDSGVGVYAPDAESYTLFADLFNPIIQDYHGGFKPTDKHPASDFGDLETLVNVDPNNEFVISTRVRCGRSLQGYPFNPCLTEAQYKEMEDKVSTTLKAVDGDLAGTYYPLTGMTKETQQQLIDDHFLFKEGDRFLQHANACRYWPTGRGIYHNDAKTFLVWVNEEDHLRIISMQKGGDLKTVFGRLVRGVRSIEAKVPFSRDDRLGFLTFCPTNLGTTIRASVHIKLPKLAADRKKLEEVAGRYNLQVRGTSGEHTESVGGVYDISNKRRLGLTEYQAVREMQDGILELIKIEKSL